MWTTAVATNFQSEPIVTIIEEHEPITGGAELPIILYTLPLPIKLTEIHVVVFSTHVKVLGELVVPKPIPLVLPKFKVGVEVTLIGVFKTLDTMLKDTPIMERPYFQQIHLVKLDDTIGKQPIDTTSEQLVDDLDVGVK